ncbi:UNVERIFIED_CONTAM: hypothetical protein GTU68_020268 [Idotea baltica]|nr:hypothetical protein [Idotea baltica]
MITDPNLYFTKGCGRCSKFDTPDCTSLRWASGQATLRALCLEVGLAETVKWGHPCYMHANRNIANIGAFKDSFRLTFFNAALMTDPNGVLTKQGPNTTNAGVLRFETAEQVAPMADIIRAYLKESMGYAASGIRAPRTVKEYDIPEELTDALDADPDLADAFAALTPGRQRGYYLHIGGAKQSTTRSARIEKARGRIFDGQGFNER